MQARLAFNSASLGLLSAGIKGVYTIAPQSTLMFLRLPKEFKSYMDLFINSMRMHLWPSLGEVRGHLDGVVFFLPLCESQGLDSKDQAEPEGIFSLPFRKEKCILTEVPVGVYGSDPCRLMSVGS